MFLIFTKLLSFFYKYNFRKKFYGIGIVLFPVDNDLRWSVLGNKKRITDQQQLIDKKLQISNYLKRNVYILGVESEMDSLFESVLKYYQD